MEHAIEREQRSLAASKATGFRMSWALSEGEAERALRITDAVDASTLLAARNSNRLDHIYEPIDPWTDSRPVGVRARAKPLRAGTSRWISIRRLLGSCFERHTRCSTALMTSGRCGQRARSWFRLFLRGSTGEARRYVKEGLDLAAAAGDSQGVAWCYYSLADIATVDGLLADARKNFEHAVMIFRQNGARSGNTGRTSD